MSRIGKQPIAIPDKVEVAIDKSKISVKGPKGNMSYVFNTKGLKIEKKDKTLLVTAENQGNETKALWGLTRTLLKNMITGVTDGFTKSLEFTGVGYKAQVTGNVLNLSLGYSHTIDFKLPEGIKAVVNKNQIDISGCNRELVGFVAAKVRAFRPPEPYKGKGLKYTEEKIIRKAGKTGAKK
jgi:large subunit ribosomal protein L6